MADTPTNTASTATPTDTASTENQEVESQELEATEEEGSEEPGKEPKKETKAQAERRKKLKVKVDGREEEEEFDLDDDERLVKDRQLAKVAQKRMAEYAQLQKEVREWIEQLRSNPRAVLEDPNLGLDLKQLAASIMQEDIENSQKSPEQLEREKIEKELRDLKAQREKEQEDFRQKEFERLQEREFERIDTLMTQAIEKTDLPKSPYVIKKMADHMIAAAHAGYDVNPEDVMPLVREEIMEDVKSMFSVMPEEVIEKMLGKEMIAKLRKRSLAKAKAAPVPVAKAIPDSGKKTDEKKPEAEKKTIRQLWGV